MENHQKKLKVLSDIASVFNQNYITWAVGGSMLLYFKNKTDEFHDIDLMVLEEDAQKVRSLLLGMGTLAPMSQDEQYKTTYFFEFTIHQVEVDIMAGMRIVCHEKEYDCSLKPEHISEYITVNGERIPLHSLDVWRRYYQLMGRPAKVEMIDQC